MKILSFVGYHNCGKTTIIEQIIKALNGKYKIGYIKHDPKEHAIIDKENSDTQRILFLNNQSAILSGDIFVFYQKPKTVEDILDYFKDCELVILEGFKSMDFPKVKIGDIENITNVVYEYKNDISELVNFVIRYINGI